MPQRILHLIVFGAALGLCLVLTPLVRRVALRFGLVDSPDGRRKVHPRPVPVAGGVAVLLSTVLALTTLTFVTDTWENALGDKGLKLVGLAIASGIIAAVGVADDYRGLLGRHKLLGQLLAVAVVIACGVEVRSLRIFGWTQDLGVLSIPFTAFWLLGAINSLNLIDGMDGLLSCLGFIICASLAALAQHNSHFEMAVIATALAGSLLGFLWFNFPPATIFLGDCGSMLIGLVVGVLAIESSLKSATTVALTVPAALLVIPILDTSAAIVRRHLTGRSLFTTDRGHLHHVLLGRGLSNRGVLLLVGGLSLMASLGALGSLVIHNELVAILSVLAVAGLLVATRLFGHAEFLLIKERLLLVYFKLRHGHEQGRIHQLVVRLQGSTDWNDLWKHVTTSAEQLGLKSVCLNVNAPALHEGYHARWGRVQSDSDFPSHWRAEMPLVADGVVVGRLEVTGLRDHDPVWEKIALVGKIVDDVELALTGLTVAPIPPSPSLQDPSDSVGPEPVSTSIPPRPPRRVNAAPRR
jgi:UDP-GlcNAc:undecaprenyl-phosphate GlcNAc-1-phosphate transferase